MGRGSPLTARRPPGSPRAYARGAQTSINRSNILIRVSRKRSIPVRPIKSRAGGRTAHGRTVMGATGMV
eukprot:4282907-Prymnesium_polylepis.1